MAARGLSGAIFETLTEDTSGDGGLTRSARAAEAGSFARHIGSLSMTKLADGLLNPKLVLSWLLAHLGAASVLVGLLVPIRESLALLPQIVISPMLQRMGRRKWAWAAGCLVQGVACGLIALCAVLLSGNAAGVAICVLLAVLATARSVCSVVYKDVLGKTVGASRRGAATGFAASAASAGVIVFALILVVGGEVRFGLVVAALGAAAALWLAAGALFATMKEDDAPGEAEGAPWAQLGLLREDAALRRFIYVRGLLTATALAPPYLLLLAPGQGGFDRLGALLLASSLASFLSSFVWGRMADRSSRRVLMLCGAVGAAALALAPMLITLGLAGTWWALPAVLFVLMVAYHGVRQGRSIYLVDMAPEGRRSAYTAVSNTVIGVVLLGSGVFGALASLAGASVTLFLFAAMSAGAAVLAAGLDEAREARDA